MAGTIRRLYEEGKRKAADAGINRHLFDADVTKGTFKSVFSREGLGSRQGIQAAAQGLYKGGIQPLAELATRTALVGDMDRKYKQKALDAIAVPGNAGQQNFTQTQKNAVQGFAIGGAALPYGAVEGATAKVATKLIPKIAASPLGRIAVSRASDVASGQLLANPEGLSFGDRARMAGTDLAFGTAIDGAGKIARPVGRYADNVTQQKNIQPYASKLNARYAETVPADIAVGRTKGGSFTGENVKVTTMGVPNVKPREVNSVTLSEPAFDKAMRSGTDPRTVVDPMKNMEYNGRQVKVDLDPATGKVLGVYPDNPAFGEYLDKSSRLIPAKPPTENPYLKLKGSDAEPSFNPSLEGASFRTSDTAAKGKIRNISNQAETPLTIKSLDPKAGSKGYGSQGMKLEETLRDNNPELNVNRLNVSPETKQVLSETIDANNRIVSKAKGAPITRKEVVGRAEQLAKDSNGAISREEILDYQARMLSTRQALAAAVDGSGGMMTPELAKVLQEDLSQSKFLASSLSNRAINADPATKSPLVSFVNEISKHGNDLEEVIAKAQGIDFNDARQASEFYRRFVKPKAGDWLDLLRYNSMLSSPNTQINNAFGSALSVGAVKPVEKSILGGIDFLNSAFTGSERKHFAGEGGAYLGSALKSMGEGARAFGDVLSGKTLGNNLDTRSIPLASKGFASGIEKGLSFPMKVMEGMDQFFTKMAEAGETGAMRYSASKGASLNDPSKIANLASSNAERTLFRRELGQKGDGTLANAIDYLPQKVQEARNSDNPYVRNVAKWTLPFIRTPTNILKQGIEYSPAGVLNLPGNSQKAEAIAKSIVGSAVFAGAATLLGAGRLTWGTPSSDKEKEAFYAAGMQPYSVKVGDKWIGYSKLGPLAFPIAMVAAVDDAQKNAKLDDSTAEQVIKGIAKYGEFFADQSYLKSIGDLLNSSQKGGVAKVVSNYPQQLVPYRAALGWVARLTDEIQRDPNAAEGSFIDKQLAQTFSQIPGLSKKVPARTDSTGEELTNPDRVTNAFSPLKVSTVREDGTVRYENLAAKNRNEKLAKQEIEALKNERADPNNYELASWKSGVDKPVSGTGKTKTEKDLPGIKQLKNGKYAYVTPEGETKQFPSQKSANLSLARDQAKEGVDERIDAGDRYVVSDPESDKGYKEVLKSTLGKQKRAYDLDKAKDSGDYKAWEKLAIDDMKDLILEKRTLDPELDFGRLLEIENKLQSYGNNVVKYRSYGGAFKKGPKAKKVSVPGSAGNAKASQAPSPKIKVIRIK